MEDSNRADEVHLAALGRPLDIDDDSKPSSKGEDHLEHISEEISSVMTSQGLGLDELDFENAYQKNYYNNKNGADKQTKGGPLRMNLGSPDSDTFLDENNEVHDKRVGQGTGIHELASEREVYRLNDQIVEYNKRQVFDTDHKQREMRAWDLKF